MSTNTQLVAGVYNFASEFITISATGDVPTSQFTTLSVEALGTREMIAGSFFIDLAGFISGTATEVSAIQVADSVLLARVAGVSIPVTVDLGFPTDAALLSGNDSITSGNGDDYLLAYDGDDSVEGGPGNDTIDGGPGNDALNGGAGDDIYIVGDAGDVISEVSGSGADTVQSYIPWVLAGGLENLTLLGTAGYGVGNAVADTMLGNAAANYLTGQGGADIIPRGWAAMTGSRAKAATIRCPGDWRGPTTCPGEMATTRFYRAVAMTWCMAMRAMTSPARPAMM